MHHTEAPLVTSVNDVIDKVYDVSRRRVLDVGCGTGSLVRWMAKRGASSVGLETQVDLVEEAMARTPVADEQYFHGRGELLPFDDRVFNAVVFAFSLHHVPETGMRAALAESCRVVKDDGAILVVEPVADGDYFEVMRIVDDETRVRLLALDAVKDVGAHGMRAGTEQFFRMHHHFQGPEHLFERLIRVDPARRPSVEANRDVLTERFFEHGKLDEKGYRFEMEIRCNLLVKSPVEGVGSMAMNQ